MSVAMRPPPVSPLVSLRTAGEVTSARRLLRRLIEVSAMPISPQSRLDRIVEMIAGNIVAEVCSIYALRAGDMLELFATHGLAAEAVHHTRLQVGEGLVGTIAAAGTIIATDDARHHPNFAHRPETGEDPYSSFLGVPILRGGGVVGVLVVQNTARKHYGEDEIEALQIIATVLAEMITTGGVVDRSLYADVPSFAARPLRLEGTRLVEGLAIGLAWLHAPRVQVTRFVAEDPAEESIRLDEAITRLQASLDAMLERSDLAAGEHREVLEAYRMFASDQGWLRRIREAINTGLSAEAAIKRVQEETQLRIGHVSDPYLRERLIDLDDLADRLLMHVVGRDAGSEARALPCGSIIVARNLSAADLVEYDRRKIRGIILEEGSTTAHVTIVARAFDIPVLGRVRRAMAQIEAGDTIGLDAENGQVFVRPSDDVVDAFKSSIEARQERRRRLAGMREGPAVTRDGINVTIAINAAFLIDLAELESSGADGVGLYRTELAFMTRPSLPSVEVQATHYGNAMDLARGREVVFRTLDIGSDKPLPYLRVPAEENPALGWRAMRLMLDRPSILRNQLRALIKGARGRPLTLMFPMIAELAEYEQARAILDRELERARAHGEPLPTKLQVGVMMEVPALFWQLKALLPRIDFLSIGSNDLLQYLFACDRGAPELGNRYDVLAPAVLTFTRTLVEQCRAAGVRLSVCGEMASQPIEAMALVGLGIRHLSVASAQIGPVKAMIRSLDAGALSGYLMRQLGTDAHSLRSRLRAYAQDHEVALSIEGLHRF